MRYKILLFVTISLLSLNGYPQIDCSEFNTPEKARIYYVNGMLSDIVNNNNARTLLEAVVSNKNDNVYRLSINRTKNFAKDGWQSFKQKSAEVDPIDFWQQWNGTNPGFPQTSPEFEAALANAIVAAATVSVNNDADLAAMVKQYLIDLNAGKKVVLVAHSQGNFYANRALEFISANQPQYTSSIGNVSVGSPSNTLAPNALLTQNDKDTVIFKTVNFFYPVLQANVSFFGLNDKRNHGFLATYMQPKNARNRIAGHIQTIVSQLTKPLNLDCEREAKIATLTASNVGSTIATLRGDLIQGKNVDAWIVYNKNPSNVICSATGKNGTGVYSAPSILSQSVTGLSPNTLYFVRACAIGQQGGLSNGGLKQFVTEKNFGKIGIPYEEDSTRFSLTVKAKVLEGVNIDAWFVRGEANNVSFTPFCAGSFDGIGHLSAGDTALGIFTDLEPGTSYRIRACAKGSDGNTYESGLISISTKSIPTATCGLSAYKGGTTGLSVIFGLGNRSGFARVTFQTFTIPDGLLIYKHDTNQLLLSTSGLVSGEYVSSFGADGVDKVDVFVIANSDIGTRWELKIECPN